MVLQITLQANRLLRADDLHAEVVQNL
jgi:hypothetical protein